MRELTLRLEWGGKTPLYEQIAAHVAAEIAAGRLQQGERLPSKRALCRHLKVSQSTVENAYQQLVAEGYIRAEPKRGFFVQPYVAPLGERPRAPGLHQALPQQQRPYYDFSTASVDTDIFPYRSWIRLFRETLYAQPELLGRGDSLGEPELREALSAFLYQYRNVRCQPAQLVIGPGVETLLSSLMYLLNRAVWAAEDPGFHGVYRIAARQGVPILPIPADDQGMDIEALGQSEASCAYVTPSHQFPLGSAMPIGRRAALLRWAQEVPGRYVIEDDYDSEFRHDTRPIPALQGMPGGGQVIYMGTFSRSLAPSMRIAYMVLPPQLLERYQREEGSQGNSVSRFEQRTLSRFILGGHYAKHLRRAGLTYARRCAALREALLQIPGASLTGDEAGLHFLLHLAGQQEAALLAQARQAGIHLRGLSQYCVAAPPPPATLVLGYAGLKDERVQEAVACLRRAWRL